MSGCFGNSSNDRYLENLTISGSEYETVTVTVKGHFTTLEMFEYDLEGELAVFVDGVDIDIDYEDDVLDIEMHCHMDEVQKVRRILDELLAVYSGLEVI